MNSSQRGFLKNIFSSTRKQLIGTPTYVVGFSTWKQYLRKYFPSRNLYFIDKNISEQMFNEIWRKKIAAQTRAEIFVWGFKAPEYILKFAAQHNKKVVFVEDGFIRSVQLGSQKAPPMSLAVDYKTPYFNARAESDLETLLSTYDFLSDTALELRAKKCISLIVEKGISKYNNSPSIDIAKFYGPKSKKRVLVIGQVEDDASIIHGCDKPITNNELVRIAANENPNAQIIYKPHPDVINGNRPGSSVDNVKDICSVITADIPLAQAFHDVDHVYTITSLSGFEALLRGITVTTIGSPFYSGWGVTDDRQENSRRKRKLSVEQIFAAAYLLYPQYFDTESGETLSLESVIEKICTEKAALQHSHSTNKIALDYVSSPKPTAIKTNVSVAKAAPSAKKVAVTKSDLPAWFNSLPGTELKQALANKKPTFLYIPWIAGHGDALVSKLSKTDMYQLAPFDFVRDIDNAVVRHEVLRFARTNAPLYRKMLINRIVPLRNKISGVIFTFDWSPAMRVLSSVCEELQIPRILIPHESVFVDRNKYYWDHTSFASTPSADLVLGWGGLQQEIFTERGYPETRFESVGAPKFDTHINYEPLLSREQFGRLYGLSADKKIILFASQPLDSQLDKKVAQESQRRAITDLFNFASANNCQLLVRLPPSKEDILGAPLRRLINGSGIAAYDDSQCYLVSPEEALYHCDVITSVNSTMLFEGLLMKRPALSMKYVEFDQVWEKAGIEAVRNATELSLIMPDLLNTAFEHSPDGMSWAANMFGIGEFDGQASERITKRLESIVSGNKPLLVRENAVTRLMNGDIIDVIAIPSPPDAFTNTQKYLVQMLNARTCVTTFASFLDAKAIASADIFFQWGITTSKNKARQQELAKEAGKPIVYVEDGFIRSLDIGLSKEPGLSIILDDTGAHYDATKPSQLERLLQTSPTITDTELTRSRAAIDKIVARRVSKYNHAPDLPLKLGDPSRRKILLVDQRFGDQSVISGLGSEQAFDRMLHDAIRNYPDHDIIIKQHPDAIKGGKSSYFNNDRLAFTQYMKNVFPIMFDINPFALFDMVDEVFVMTSGMGFEALMAGKKVHCYGMPFYAGWGVTEDRQSLERRTRKLSIEELFHFAYIKSSRYFHPEKNSVVQVEDVVDYIADLRDAI